jgi:hypothetical protein
MSTPLLLAVEIALALVVAVGMPVYAFLLMKGVRDDDDRAALCRALLGRSTSSPADRDEVLLECSSSRDPVVPRDYTQE